MATLTYQWTKPFYGITHLEGLRAGVQVTVTEYHDKTAECWVKSGAGFSYPTTQHATVAAAKTHGIYEAEIRGLFL